MTDDLDEDLKTEHTKRQEEIREKELSDLSVVMSTPHGRRFMYRLLYKHASIEHSSYAPNPSDSAFNQGLQKVGFVMLSDIQAACFDQYLLMLQEARALKV